MLGEYFYSTHITVVVKSRFFSRRGKSIHIFEANAKDGKYNKDATLNNGGVDTEKMRAQEKLARRLPAVKPRYAPVLSRCIRYCTSSCYGLMC